MKNTRVLSLIIFISLIAILTGCVNSGDQKLSANGDSDPELAAIIYSSPLNYSAVLDNVKASRKVEIRSYKDILELFEKLKYTTEAWQEGVREVPRVYFPIIGKKWGSTTSKEITVENKKRLFFRGLAPLYYNVVRPDFGPEWQLRFQAQILLPKSIFSKK